MSKNAMFCVLENVENHVDLQTLVGHKLRFQVIPGTISRSGGVIIVDPQVGPGGGDHYMRGNGGPVHLGTLKFQ